MTTRFYLLAAIIVLVSSCSLRYEFRITVPEVNNASSAKKVSLTQLLKNYKQYHGQKIETIGFYHAGMEESAIYPYPDAISGETQGFNVRRDLKLKMNKEAFGKSFNRRVRIRGIIDTTDTGHVGDYLATISQIYFWELQKPTSKEKKIPSIPAELRF